MLALQVAAQKLHSATHDLVSLADEAFEKLSSEGLEREDRRPSDESHADGVGDRLAFVDGSGLPQLIEQLHVAPDVGPQRHLCDVAA